MTGPTRLSRRAVVAGGVSAAVAVLAGCGSDTSKAREPGSGEASSASTTGAAPASAPSSSSPPTDPVTTVAPTGPADFVVRGPADSDAVALTFHTNGDVGLARELLDVLVGHEAVATCFIVGEWLAAHPEWAQQLEAAGLELANHTQTHPTFARLSPEQMTDEVVQCRDLLVELTGSPGRFFRPSGTSDGASSPSPAILAVAGEAGYSTVLGWDVDPLDYQDPGSAAVEERVLAGVTGGSVVSLHFGHPGTVAALDAILSGLEQRGLRTVTASELLDS